MIEVIIFTSNKLNWFNINNLQYGICDIINLIVLQMKKRKTDITPISSTWNHFDRSLWKLPASKRKLFNHSWQSSGGVLLSLTDKPQVDNSIVDHCNSRKRDCRKTRLFVYLLFRSSNKRCFCTEFKTRLSLELWNVITNKSGIIKGTF